MTRKRHVIEIEEDTSEIGSIAENWCSRGRLYANVHEVRGGETFRGVQLEASVAAVVDTNYHSWVTPQMQLRHNGEVLHIDAVLDRDGRKRNMELHCSRVANDG